jgi:hypothetical protein
MVFKKPKKPAKTLATLSWFTFSELDTVCRCQGFPSVDTSNVILLEGLMPYELASCSVPLVAVEELRISHESILSLEMLPCSLLNDLSLKVNVMGDFWLWK